MRVCRFPFDKQLSLWTTAVVVQTDRVGELIDEVSTAPVGHEPSALASAFVSTFDKEPAVLAEWSFVHC
jgi:hypothetical protein